MDKELFELAVQASTRVPPKNVIGTQSEHRVHAALKYYFQPDDTLHEIKIDGYICDAVSEDGMQIYEIQTRSFDKLRKKLAALSEERSVTVIYPVITEKRVIVTYAESGETTIRKSPKKRIKENVFEELYKIKEYLKSDTLSFKLVLLKCDEFRVYKGDKSSRKPFSKPISTERIPTDLIDIVSINGISDLSVFLPSDLPECFNSATFAKKKGISRSLAQIMLNVLTDTGVIKRIGKIGNAYIYELSDRN